MGTVSQGQLGPVSGGTTPVPIPIATGVVSASAGYQHTLFVKSDGSLWAMGFNGSGRLGDGTAVTRFNPVQIATNVSSVSAGYDCTLFIKNDGSLWAAGGNAYGQLGDGTTTARTTPIQIATGVSSVVTRYRHAVFAKTDGTLWTTGDNSYGQLGDGSTVSRTTPVQIATGVSSATAGYYHTAFTKADGSLWTVGFNASGQLGDGTNTSRTLPAQIAHGVAAVSAGAVHTAFIDTDGSLWAMGDNYYGQLGDGTSVTRADPAQVAANVTSVSLGETHTAFIAADGSLWTMGSNQDGQLGDGTSISRSSPVQIATGVASVTVGKSSTHFTKSDGSLWAAGNNAYGQLGDGTIVSRATPVPIATNVASVSAGSFVTNFVMTDGSLWAVGSGSDGQFGDGTTTSRTSPVQIADGVTSVSTGNGHTLFIRTGGTLWAVGNNYYGQLGDGTTLTRFVPVQIATDVVSVSAGDGYTHFIKADGSLWAAGRNYEGQLGDGTTLNRATPVRVADQVASVSSAFFHTLFVKTDGSLWATGDNDHGELGHDAPSNYITPVQIGAGVAAAKAGVYYSAVLLKPTPSEAPAITAQPSSVRLPAGQDATFTVAASGSGSLSYQWWKDGSILAGATSANLTLPSISGSDEGAYFVRVTNSHGSMDSAAVPLSLNKITQSMVSFPAIPDFTYGSPPFDLSAAASSGLPTVFTVVSGPATVLDRTVSITGAGTVTIRATQPGNDLYLPSFGSIERLFFVNRAPLTAIATSQTRAYGDPNPPLSITYGGFVNNDTAASITDPTIGTNATAASALGTYPITLSGGDAANYTLILFNGTLTVTDTKPPATVELSNLSATYDGTAKSATASTSPSGLAVAFTYNGDTTAPTNAGSYAVVATVVDANYSGTATGMLTISKTGQTAPVISSAASATFGSSYTAAANTGFGALLWSLGAGSTATTPAINATTGAVTFASIGTVVIHATFAGDTNHTPSTSADFTLTVAPAPVTFALSATTFTYTGSPQGPRIIPTPANATIRYVTIFATDAGNYTESATAYGNYSGSNTNLSWVMTKAEQGPTVVTSSASATFGTAYTATVSFGYGALTWALGTGSTAVNAAINAATGAVSFGSTGTVVVSAAYAGDINHTASTSADFTITVAKATPTITWPPPASVYIGTALSPTQLNATSGGVPGTFAYAPAEGTVLNPGDSQPLSVTFTPTDTANYNSVTATTTLTVINKIAPVINWTAPAAITYGTALGTTQLNATANVPGTFAYTPASGTVLNAGPAQTLSVTFTPTDPATYATMSATTTISVNKATPVITWPAPSPIAYGTSVRDQHLNASSGGVPGRFVYFPESGAIPNIVGVVTLRVTFTPTDTANYNSATGSTALTVTPRDYSGSYFGTFASGGYWALAVRPDATATYIAYLPSRQSAIVANLTVGLDGDFRITGTEVKPTATAVSGYALATPESPVSHNAAAGSSYTLAGQIGADRRISGGLTGIGETFTGAADVGAVTNSTGLFTASALGTASGTTYAIVGASGQTVIVTTTPAAVDGAAGTVNASGQLTATTSNNAALSLTINTAAQTVSASLTPAGSTTPITYAGLSAAVTPIARVVNLSVRTTAGTGDQTLIVGLVVIGSGSKTLLLRGIGPALLPQGVTNALADPTMRLLNGSGAEVSANNDWGGSAQMSANFSSVGAFALPASSKDAALFNTLPTGLYSFHVFPNGAGTGIALAEVYDADDDSSAASVFNISARTQVGTGENILIAGFVITGNSPKTVLIRGLGPTLAAQGVTGAVVNPQLFLFGSAGLIASNDDWGGTTALKNAFATTGAGALTADNSKDAALLVTLMPGVYSAQVSGVGSTTGIGLVEIFLVP
jgi:alpha-tubulin suppressor-like RCC1 family protein